MNMIGKVWGWFYGVMAYRLPYPFPMIARQMDRVAGWAGL